MVSAKIEHLLVEKKISQKDLAKMMNIAPSTLSTKITKDSWSERDIQRVCEALDVTYDPVFTMNDTGKQF